MTSAGHQASASHAAAANARPAGRPQVNQSTERKRALGLCEWFPAGDRARVEGVLAEMQQLGLTHLRTGISWADWHTPAGDGWIKWLLPRLAAEVEVLPYVVYTPPSLGLVPQTAAPPRDPKSYADFIDYLIRELGEHFAAVELWDKPNRAEAWDTTLDPDWVHFGRMVGGAAYWAKQLGKQTVLGGMSPVDPAWLRVMFNRGVMDHIDVVGIHGLPEPGDSSWHGWAAEVEKAQAVLDEHGSPARIWITEAGYATAPYDEFGQLRQLVAAQDAPVARVYWTALHDAAPAVEAGFAQDRRELSLGLKRNDGTPKLLHRIWAAEGMGGARQLAALVEATTPLQAAPLVKHEPYVLLVGGAGFIGSNLAHRLMAQGQRVLVFDSLARPGVETNLRWLYAEHPDRLWVQVGDVRSPLALADAVRHAERVYHFGAQVAVTTSLDSPIDDFEVNARGTLNLLEALRSQGKRIPLLFTSTNKVYGDLADVALRQDGIRYYPADRRIDAHGISEARPVAFHSPYGCSKGAADQYVLDYAHTYGMPSTVFRMSCIYGPRQFGNEDQGWVAHFMIRALLQQPITLYGDGKQVRDLLFVDDLVNALELAHAQIDRTAGEAFNVGGGPQNAVSLLELLAVLEQLQEAPIRYRFDDWRRGDQRYYVSDTEKLAQTTGWRAQVGVQSGLKRLYSWLAAYHPQVVARPAYPRPDAVKPQKQVQVNGNGQIEHKPLATSPAHNQTEEIYGG